MIRQKKKAKMTLPLVYVETLRNAEERREYVRGIIHTTREGARMYRANHGGGMPCPADICSTPEPNQES